MSPCPTSPIQRSPVRRSNENRQALRRPSAAISHVAPGASHVQTQELAELRAHVLRAILGIAARAAVADGRVQLPVRPEDEVAPVVVAVRIGHREERRAARRDCRRAVRAEARHDVPAVSRTCTPRRTAGSVRSRVEREAEQALLATRRDQAAHVEERLGAHLTALGHVHEAVLVHDVAAVGLTGCVGQDHGVLGLRGHLHEPERR